MPEELKESTKVHNKCVVCGNVCNNRSRRFYDI